MFTPEDPNAPKSPPGESPYAGWVGLGISLHAKDTHALNSAELSIGTVGPNSQVSVLTIIDGPMFTLFDGLVGKASAACRGAGCQSCS